MTVTGMKGEADICRVDEEGDSRVHARWNAGTPVREGLGGDHPRPCRHPEAEPGGTGSHCPVPCCFQQTQTAEDPCLPRLQCPSEIVSQTTDWGPQKKKRILRVLKILAPTPLCQGGSGPVMTAALRGTCPAGPPPPGRSGGLPNSRW